MHYITLLTTEDFAPRNSSLFIFSGLIPFQGSEQWPTELWALTSLPFFSYLYRRGSV